MLTRIIDTIESVFHDFHLYTSYSFVTVLALLAAASYGTYQLHFHPLAKVPGPRIAALTRLYMVYHIRFSNMSEVIVNLHKKYGSSVRIAPNEVSFDNAEASKKMYSPGAQFYKADFYDAATDSKFYLNDKVDRLDLFAERDMPLHRVQRRYVGPLYTMPAMKQHEHHVDTVIRKLVTRLTAAFAGQVVVLDDWIHFYILDVLAQMTFAQNPGYISHGADGGSLVHSDSFWLRLSLCGQWVSTTYLMHMFDFVKGAYIDPVLSKFKTATKVSKVPRLFVWALPILQGRMSKLTGKEEKVNEMARMHHQINKFDDQDTTLEEPCILTGLLDLQATRPEWSKIWTIGMSITNFAAGHDTITSTLTSILYYIFRSPSALARVRTELANAIMTGTLTDPKLEDAAYANYDDILTALPYLSACIKEAMRLHPVIAMNMVREVPAPGTDINRFVLPTGTIVGVNPHAYNLNPAYFGVDASEFRPERWMSTDISDNKNEEAATTAAAWEHYNLNWGGPSRTCPGQHMARLIMVKMLFVLFRSVRLDIVDGGHISKGFLGRMVGVKVKVVVDSVAIVADK